MLKLLTLTRRNFNGLYGNTVYNNICVKSQSAGTIRGMNQKSYWWVSFGCGVHVQRCQLERRDFEVSKSAGPFARRSLVYCE
jgi:hypothetical protein